MVPLLIVGPFRSCHKVMAIGIVRTAGQYYWAWYTRIVLLFWGESWQGIMGGVRVSYMLRKCSIIDLCLQPKSSFDITHWRQRLSCHDFRASPCVLWPSPLALKLFSSHCFTILTNSLFLLNSSSPS